MVKLLQPIPQKYITSVCDFCLHFEVLRVKIDINVCHKAEIWQKWSKNLMFSFWRLNRRDFLKINEYCTKCQKNGPFFKMLFSQDMIGIKIRGLRHSHIPVPSYNKIFLFFHKTTNIPLEGDLSLWNTLYKHVCMYVCMYLFDKL